MTIRFSLDILERLDELRATTGKSYNQLIEEGLRTAYFVEEPQLDSLAAIQNQLAAIECRLARLENDSNIDSSMDVIYDSKNDSSAETVTAVLTAPMTELIQADDSTSDSISDITSDSISDSISDITSDSISDSNHSPLTREELKTRYNLNDSTYGNAATSGKRSGGWLAPDGVRWSMTGSGKSAKWSVLPD